MPRKLNESAGVIVGGTSGLGFASAKALLADGLQKLTLCGRDVTRGRNALSKLAAEYPGAYLHFVQCDATNPTRTTDAIKHAELAMGRIDVLVSSSGGRGVPKLAHEMQITEVMPVINELVSGILHPVHAVLPVMMKQRAGSIVCITSDAAKIATPGEAALGAGMAAISMFCKTLALEAKRSCIRVNCVSPSIVHGTPLYDVLMADPFSNKLFTKAEKRAHLGAVEADDVAEAVRFLANPAASKITGQVVSVTGGISAA